MVRCPTLCSSCTPVSAISAASTPSCAATIAVSAASTSAQAETTAARTWSRLESIWMRARPRSPWPDGCVGRRHRSERAGSRSARSPWPYPGPGRYRSCPRGRVALRGSPSAAARLRLLHEIGLRVGLMDRGEDDRMLVLPDRDRLPLRSRAPAGSRESRR